MSQTQFGRGAGGQPQAHQVQQPGTQSDGNAGASPANPQAQQQHNAGNADDIMADFWSGDSEAVPQQTNPSGGNQNNNAGNQPQPQQPVNPAQLLERFTAGLNFANIPSEAVDAMAQGDMTKFNAAVANMNRQAVGHSVTAMSQMMSTFQQNILREVRGMMDGTLNQRDNDAYLAQQFPAADALAQPIVKGIFDQAMVKAKGDKAKAAQMTRAMLNRMGMQFGSPASKGSRQDDDSVDWSREFGLTSQM